ncbi:karyopherin beta 1 isoform 4 [Cavenderia fasciculata]|uniref:Karyopherin beta 1 isoform 4 n=1 Tax=Cavenderia fasciculata TaxID=261658 RepID=F4QBQ5_CACFS|nr:karyopherin beta 1 isoform 4 [Cavenderia fasciculata]EGG14643.1 karyopherin beta 1 isoform 4 [Cavenderia fasciculata]|eukprot:XP_004351151.1 karyopherin beta 1 isoform 4 [Cavenderia fasciculata]
MDLVTILTNARDHDEAKRRDAEERLAAASQKDFGGFLHALALELANNDRQATLRQLAGIILKNSIYSNDANRYEVCQKQWIAVPENTKNEVRVLLTNTLHSQTYESRHTAAQVIAKLALIDLPTGSWQNLVPSLIENLTNQTSSEFTKQSSLQTIGYICEEINPDIMQGFSDQILTVIIHGMRDASNLVKHSATDALYNALEFVRHNFEKKEERDYIMKTIFETCGSTEPTIKRLAFENLVKIVPLYYGYIFEYMGDIYNITVNAIQTEPNEGVVLQAIEFWTTLCEEEYNLSEDDLSKEVMSKALAPFIPVIVQTLLKQDEDQTDSWNVCMAGATCITYIALNVTDSILEPIVPFISQNLASQEWRLAEAACVALGSILEGPTAVEFQRFLANTIPTLIEHATKNPNSMVRDSASWTLARMCAHQIEAVADQLDIVLQALVNGTKDPLPKVAAHACWGIHNICQAFEIGSVGQYSSLNKLFPHIAQALYVAAHRADDEDSLRVNAYEALNSLISFSNADDNLIVEVLNFILVDFEKTFTMEGDQDERKQTQALICSTLQTISTVLKDKIKPQVQRMLYLLFNVFKTQSHIIYEEALLAIGSVIHAIEGDFKPYLQAFLPILTECLRNVEFGEVSNISIGIVSDITRALNKEFTPLASSIIPLIIQDLIDPKISMNAKPNALSCLGDIALAIGSDFIQYLPNVMPILEQATTVPIEDEEYLNSLRNSIFDAYIGIIHGLKSENASDKFTPYVTAVLQFVSIVYAEKDRTSYQVIGAAIGLLGDLAQSLGDQVKAILRHDIVNNLIQLGSSQDGNREVAEWAREVIFK